MNWTEGRTWVGLALCLLSACGGGSGVRETPAPATRIMLQGAVVDSAPVAQGAIEVKPLAGVPTSTRRDDSGRYELIVEGLTAPYVLWDETAQLAGVALAPGRAPVTPLSHLLLAELQGDDPAHFYQVLGPVGAADFSRIDAAQLADAEQRLLERLQRQLGLTLPADLGRFHDSAFEPVAGDPMMDLISGLHAALAQHGSDLATLVQEVALHGRLCDRARVTLDLGGAHSVFCPMELTSAVDDTAGTEALHFASPLGDELQVLLRSGAVASVRWLRDGRERAACTGAGCAGLGVGVPDADGHRLLTWKQVRLSGATPASVQGRLSSGEGPVQAPCAGRRFSARHTDGLREEECVGQRLVTRQFQRLAHGFTGAVDGSRLLDIRLDGDRVAWISLGRTWGEIEYRCIGRACSGVSVGPAAADGVRRIVLAGTRMVRALGDGQVDPADTVQVEADVLTARTPPAPTDSCPMPILLTLESSDGTVMPLCDTRPGASIGIDDVDGDGRFETVMTDSTNPESDVVSVVYNLDLAQPTQVTMSRVRVEAFELAYRCRGGDCQGGSVTFTTDLRYRFQFDGTVLDEVLPDGSPGTRHLVLRGTILSAALVVAPGD
ncbi:hypothetical protein KAK06_04755 [Ideonella sp. 4Y11]|uniref:Uncharacterized protein n=1 Tax=Ideonella aquatica TaxID=2824119 RepID=A0A941BIX0_9BURK|nr:hypothetical protein [Ideonella aquatica]MBQ0958258.1 hypothetical protein [Ideonella aquatica]